MNTLITNLIAPEIAAAVEPVQQLAAVTASVAGVSLLDSTAPGVVSLPIQIAALAGYLNELSGVPDYPAVASTRTNMRNEVLRQRMNAMEQRVAAGEQALASKQLVDQAQDDVIQEVIANQGATTARLDELVTRVELLRAIGQNQAADLAANQAHDTEQDARLTAAESLNAAQALDLIALHQQQNSTAAALAANTAADQATAAQVATTQATAAQALALGQAEHATNVAQQSQLDANAAQDALDRAQQTKDEAAIAQAQATAAQALALAQADATAAQQALAAAQAAQTTATGAASAAAAAQATANSAATAAAGAQTTATLAKAAADAAQAKADVDAIAAAAAQATADQAKAAAASNATALAALQTALAGKLDAALVRRGSQATPAVTVQVAQPTTVQITFNQPFADANYEVFLSKPSGGLLGVELGWLTKTATGFTLTLRNTGLASLAVTASAVDYFAIHN